MAKQQQIILLHGTGQATSNEQLKLVQGEIAIRNAASKEESEIYSLTSGGDLVAFPSKAYVTKAIGDLNYSTTIEGINQKISALESADTTIRNEFAAADNAITSAYTALAATLRGEFEGADDAIVGDIEEINTVIEGINTEITNLKTADTNLEIVYKKADADIISAYTAADEAIETAYKKADADIISAYTAADEALQTAVNSKVAQSVYGAKVAEIEGDIDDLESVLNGYTGEGSVKTAVDSKVAQSDYNTKMGELDGQIAGIQQTIQGLDSDFATDDELEAAVSGLTNNIAAAEARATTLLENGTFSGVKVSETTVESGTRTYKVEGVDLATNTDLTALKVRVDALTASGVEDIDDSYKSVRTIANEELARQLLEGADQGAENNFKTLKELADWLEKHPEDAAAMNTAIQQNASDIATEKSRAEGVESALDTKTTNEKTRAEGKEGELLTAINNEKTRAEGKEGELLTAINNEKTRAEEAEGDLNDLITGLDTRVGTNETNISRLTTTVANNKTELEGKITAKTVVVTASSDFVSVTPTVDATTGSTFTITTNDVASASALTALDTRVQTAEGSVTELLTFKNTTVPATYATKDELNTEISGVTATASANKQELEGKIAAEENRAKGVEEAHANRLVALEGGRIKDVVIENTTNNKISLTKSDNVITINVDSMVINGGTYDVTQ